LFALGNILHGGVVHTASPGSDGLLLATGWMVDMVMSGVLLRSSALSGDVPSMPIVEADVGGGSSGRWYR
jgi:hypothetical protein